MADAAQLKQELKNWERTFREQHDGRAPTKEDTKRDPVIAAKYKLYRSLPKANSSAHHASTSTAANSSRNATSPSLSSIPKPRFTESPTKASSSNPFSPLKQSQSRPREPRRRKNSLSSSDEETTHAGRSRSSSAVDENPFLVSPRKASAISATSMFSAEKQRNTSILNKRSAGKAARSVSPSPLPPITRSTPLSRPHSPKERQPSTHAPSPKKIRQLIASERPPAQTSTDLTPRTKARKRMRGEDVPATPSEGRRKKTRFSSDGSGDDAHDVFGPSTSASLLGARHSSEPEEDIDELPDSPVKPARGSAAATNFRPIFDDYHDLSRRKAVFGSSAASRGRFAPTNDNPRSESEVSIDVTTLGSDDENSVLGHAPPTSMSGSEHSDSDKEVHVEYALYPPSPPPGPRREPRFGPSRTKGNGTTTKTPSEVPIEDEIMDDSSEALEIELTHNVAWGARVRGSAQTSSSDLLDESLLIQPRPSSPLPSGSESGSAVEDVDLSGELHQALTISSASMDADNVVRESRESSAWRAFVQGHQSSSSHRPGDGIWDVGEVEEGDSEDWESEPDGWNGSED